ncbi:hypothetical protein JDF658_03760 [Carboxydocella sp. JDF658]|nr:hypothetical protein JDF658_03760 [Carboxydocella sp. JDF658]
MEILSHNDNFVIYVEPIPSLFKKIVRPEEFDGNEFKIRFINKNLVVVRPPSLLPGMSKFPHVAKINNIVLIRYLRSIFNKLCINESDLIIWNYLHTSGYVLKRLKKKITIYEIVDNIKHYPGVNQALVQKMEKHVLIMSDLIFTTSRTIFNNLQKKVGNKIFYSPNGVNLIDFNNFNTHSLNNYNLKENERQKIIGYVGGIYSWIDLDLIKYIASKNKDWKVVMIGPIGKDIDLNTIKNFSNIKLIGKKEKETIPYYIKNFDVCINPFKLTDLTKAVNPLKVYEYLACGKPIVSVPMNEILHLKDVIYFADNYEEFVNKIENALVENDIEKTNERLKIVKQYDFKKILNDMCFIINNYLEVN